VIAQAYILVHEQPGGDREFGAPPSLFSILLARSEVSISRWRRKLRALIGDVRLRAVASAVFVVEVHGYHSRKYSPSFRVPSQEYSRYLVREAITRGAHFVVMRGWREWLRLVPDLRDAENVSFVRSVQNPAISRANCPDSYDALVESIGRAG
jgi:hypothetical protein